MRCKACDAELTSIPTHPFNKADTDDMCSVCIISARSLWKYSDDHEYLFEDATEGLTPMIDCSHH